MFRTLMTQTERERIGSLDGVNLFFGALLGANLGSLEGVSLPGYTMIVLILCGTVMTLRNYVESERRRYATSLLALYVVAVASFLYRGTGLKGLPVEDRWRLAITLAIWIATVVMIVLMPTSRKEQTHGAPDI
jgi:hypothetical protein